MAASRLKRSRVFYGWWVLGVTCLATFVSVGAGPGVVTVLVKPMADEFRSSHTELLGALTVSGLLAAVVSPILGRMVDRYGARVVHGRHPGAVRDEPGAHVPDGRAVAVLPAVRLGNGAGYFGDNGSGWPRRGLQLVLEEKGDGLRLVLGLHVPARDSSFLCWPKGWWTSRTGAWSGL